MKPVSSVFFEIFSPETETNKETCQCGKTHFDISNEWDWHPGELAELKEHASTSQHTIPRTSAITHVLINEDIYVCGCDCRMAEGFENFILQHPREISAYLSRINPVHSHNVILRWIFSLPFFLNFAFTRFFQEK